MSHYHFCQISSPLSLLPCTGQHLLTALFCVLNGCTEFITPSINGGGRNKIEKSHRDHREGVWKGKRCRGCKPRAHSKLQTLLPSGWAFFPSHYRLRHSSDLSPRGQGRTWCKAPPAPLPWTMSSWTSPLSFWGGWPSLGTETHVWFLYYSKGKVWIKFCKWMKS